jgi:hypothetical protein
MGTGVASKFAVLCNKARLQPCRNELVLNPGLQSLRLNQFSEEAIPFSGGSSSNDTRRKGVFRYGKKLSHFFGESSNLQAAEMAQNSAAALAAGLSAITDRRVR